jgi:hypothetical protein
MWNLVFWNYIQWWSSWYNFCRSGRLHACLSSLGVQAFILLMAFFVLIYYLST